MRTGRFCGYCAGKGHKAIRYAWKESKKIYPLKVDKIKQEKIQCKKYQFERA